MKTTVLAISILLITDSCVREHLAGKPDHDLRSERPFRDAVLDSGQR